jgi:hypothetical protein
MAWMMVNSPTEHLLTPLNKYLQCGSYRDHLIFAGATIAKSSGDNARLELWVRLTGAMSLNPEIKRKPSKQRRNMIYFRKWKAQGITIHAHGSFLNGKK